MVFIIAVNSVLFGLLTATVVVIAGAMTLVAVIVGLVAALAFFTVSVWLSAGPYFTAWKGHVPLSPTPDSDSRLGLRGRRTRLGIRADLRAAAEELLGPDDDPDDHRDHGQRDDRGQDRQQRDDEQRRASLRPGG